MRLTRSEFVCGRCFDESGMVDFCDAYAEAKRCDFCGRRSRKPIAAPLHEVLYHVRETVYRHFDNPANSGLGFESAEGGYQGITYHTEDVFESLGLDFSTSRMTAQVHCRTLSRITSATISGSIVISMASVKRRVAPLQLGGLLWGCPAPCMAAEISNCSDAD